MKGHVTLKILEAIGRFALNGVATMIDFHNAMMTAGYGASYHQLSRTQEKIRTAREQSVAQEQERKLAQKRLENLCYKLRRDGLLSEYTHEGKTFLKLTKKGEAELAKLRKRHQRVGNIPPISSYTSERSDALTIIAFDIPEHKRPLRIWLRAVLHFLQFRSLQKSVLIGKMKIPKQLISDMDELGIIAHVEIFSISKTGSLRQVV